MNQILNTLAQVDNQLQTIAVRGEDTFAMVNARKLLRVAYDMVRKEAQSHAEQQPTAVLDGSRDTGD